MKSVIIEIEFPSLLELGWIGDNYQMPQEALILDSQGHTIGQISLAGLQVGEPLFLQAMPQK